MATADAFTGATLSVAGIAHQLVVPFMSLSDQRNLLSYLAAALFVLLSALVVRRTRRLPEPRAAWRLLRRSTVWCHRSAILDYKWFAVNLVLIAFVVDFVVVAPSAWGGLAGDALASLFGAPVEGPGGPWRAAFGTLILFCFFDFGYWLGHYVQHRVPLLWEFHKVHHSAEVLTPAAEYRQHPVEIVLMATVVGLFIGLGSALVFALAGLKAAGMALVAFKMLLLLHLMTFHHLRHSHIGIAFTGWAGRLLHSPAHHHIHHSSDPRHFDRNFGFILSVWDWAAGSLCMPQRGQRLTLGIGPEGRLHDGVARTFMLPFRQIFRRTATEAAPPAHS
jgi:sterol desaturase/sphingolipid hydroxylase (fatty acid hydroxylase superfamily)